ncbi:NAD(P)-dependent alcohol dehydrogenase [Kineosporia sp. J2-2]|uniref:alcohol dehydrogenase n=1 Tax=Kineosporia corallincola TaxID=2835133 RepID=A0ABS5TPR7_9ACTN|nr:NAD(P)-dependent alcohol dehydrogenase [Kineosporia corallincola]MBT0773102.1 NAD(P)-dependent alcohol dehydrogenase [Kineosporia corallincola]
MKAVQYRTIGKGPEVVEVDKPTPGPGQVLLKVTAAGLCHSDELVMSVPDAMGYQLPMTLGHEPAGIVEELGEGATGIEVGTPVIVYGCWGCGVCEMCAAGKEMLCLKGMTSPGLGSDGAMADYMVVDTPRHLVPIGDLDPVRAASLTDAALTPYQAILSVLPKLHAGTTTVVLGVGGLGHVAVQLLRELTGTRIVAMDVTQEKLDLAKECGAHEVLPSGPDAAAAVKKMTDGRGAHVVFDFVGIDQTSELALACAGFESHVVIVGAGGGGVKIGFLTAPYNIHVSTSLWGGRAELGQLVTMAQRGQIHIQTKTFSLDDVPKAYEMLHRGEIIGRAVGVPSL